jgi:N-acetylneuraminic acid mutarotase
LHDAAASTLAGRAYVFGGGEPSHDEITPVGPGGGPTPAGRLPAPASDVAAATVGGTAYVVGGYTGTQPLDTIVAWTGSGTGSIVARLPRPVRYAAVAATATGLVIAGGTVDGAASRSVYSFDPSSGRVRRLGLLPRAITHAGAATLGRWIYLVGGRGSDQGSQSAGVLAIDPLSGRVEHAGRLPVALSDAGVATVAGHLLVAGGRTASGAVSDRILTLAPPVGR